MPDLHLILWTVREGELLEQAVAWCAERGLEFYAVNSNYPEELPSSSAGNQACRKVTADLYIDDRNLGELPEWTEIYRKITGASPTEAGQSSSPTFFGRLFGKH